MYDDYNYRSNPYCYVFDNPFVNCERCGATCKEFDLADGICSDCAAESEVNK